MKTDGEWETETYAETPTPIFFLPLFSGRLLFEFTTRETLTQTSNIDISCK